MIGKVIDKCKHRLSAAMMLVFGALMTVSMISSETRADQQPPMTTVAYQSGTITSIYENTFQIDHRTYSLTPDAVLLDRHGDELNASYLRVDIEVKYRLQKDLKDKIDRMILYLPH